MCVYCILEHLTASEFVWATPKMPIIVMLMVGIPVLRQFESVADLAHIACMCVCVCVCDRVNSDTLFILVIDLLLLPVL